MVAENRKTPVKKLSFGEAVGEVEEILQRLEDDEIDIDQLSQEVKRAVELLQLCRQKLDRTDAEVRELVAGLQPATEAEGGPDLRPGPE